jgi:DNA transformation protein
MDPIEIEEMFAGLGEVSIRRMFGGKGVYHQGLIVGVVFHGDMLLKADAVSGAEFADAGATQWAYEGKSGKAVLMPYWSIPDEAYDDPEQMARWVRLAYDAALRAPPK